MEHCVAIGTDGSKIGNGVKLIFAVCKGKRPEMMNMNEILSDLTVSGLKVETAH